MAATAPAWGHPGSGIAVAADGQVYFTDTGRGVWRIDLQGRLHEHPGPAFHWLALDPASAFASAPWPAPLSTETQRVGRSPTLIFGGDFPLTIGGDGALYFPRVQNRSLELVRQVSTGERRVLAVLARSPADLWIDGLTAGPDDAIFISKGDAVRRIGGDGAIRTVAERIVVEGCAPPPGISAADGPVLRDLDVTAEGTVFVAAEGCGALLRITLAGSVEVALRAESPWSPTAVAVDGDRLWVLEYSHPAAASQDRAAWIPRVRRVSGDGKVETIATVVR